MRGGPKVVRDWSGYVTVVGETSFEAVIEGDRQVHGAEIPLELLSDDQRSMVAPGISFRWVLTEENGEATQSLTFIRERWTVAEVEDARVRAAELLDGLVAK